VSGVGENRVAHRRLTFRHQGLDVRLTDVAGRVVTKLLA